MKSSPSLDCPGMMPCSGVGRTARAWPLSSAAPTADGGGRSEGAIFTVEALNIRPANNIRLSKFILVHLKKINIYTFKDQCSIPIVCSCDTLGLNLFSTSQHWFITPASCIQMPRPLTNKKRPEQGQGNQCRTP